MAEVPHVSFELQTAPYNVFQDGISLTSSDGDGGARIFTSASTWESIDVSEFIDKNAVLDLYNPLAELVFAQEMRIRELEKKIDELSSKQIV